MEFVTAYCSDVGTVKRVNEDALCIKYATGPRGPVLLAVVCDGMGGLQQGDYASAFTVNCFVEWFDRTIGALAEQGFSGFEMDTLWRDLVDYVNQSLLDYATAREIKLGTTLSALLLAENSYYIMQVGDSRVYQIKNQIQQLTEDQSFVANEVRMGCLTPEEAKKDRRRNVLLQCIGAMKEVTPAFYEGRSIRDSVFLLCSDGFVHELSEWELLDELLPHWLTGAEALQQKAEKLVETVKERGERDNITVALVWVKGEMTGMPGTDETTQLL